MAILLDFLAPDNHTLPPVDPSASGILESPENYLVVHVPYLLSIAPVNHKG